MDIDNYEKIRSEIENRENNYENELLKENVKLGIHDIRKKIITNPKRASVLFYILNIIWQEYQDLSNSWQTSIENINKTELLYAHLPEIDRHSWLIIMTNEFIKDIQEIDRKLQGRILEAITYISQKPLESMGDTVKPLTGDLKGMWRYRIGDHRLVYIPLVESKKVILITFASRKEVYKV
ncbi:type II toxin-antitoxin system RelE/ParE family toxin [Calothrix sp. FACHB-1219]|uniref:type II toxin-antitoxin system RelE family toxin n=1 Tax=unclassified Calothrix TaxID=2619626 RepID=UPI001689CEA1|nr:MULTISPECIES: type II toxin-antitoxin system RelE/ParE family toxin [unclassified Calothrix]MBD2207556.1 type II toxin-antitoxin system RelE/ParE family toxin [Calothrix sp. FACHB-168]MBD2222157.1 type II toxin-antitoxin system RelE/ParE family toxin [Calothrix sp. FACHB-1219]